jgi:hypothetical protein
MSTGKTTLALLLSALLPAAPHGPQAMIRWSIAQKPPGVFQPADRQLRPVVRRQLAGAV